MPVLAALLLFFFRFSVAALVFRFGFPPRP